ncbi:hypothetical protein [Chitinophaga flava]|uniref:Uncharacterized protein n=1 Tax=Chitinophaga flava TaxID=2259036 RepID=A0A365XRE2_9BACT|nr:hypothetical protein [Chitinophaga flava]RBL88145.1 hypothetical protein DF182_32000 [Chitinophaga flava]
MANNGNNFRMTSFRAADYQLNNRPMDLAPARRDFYKIWLILDECHLSLETADLHIQQPALIVRLSVGVTPFFS